MSDDGEIRSVQAQLAILADEGDLEEYVSLFTEDARWDMPGGELQGRDNLLAGAIERREAGNVGPGTNTRHVITTQSVVVNGDEAEARAYFQFWVNTATEPSVVLFGNYHDRFQRTSDGWKLAHRVITFG